MKITFSMAAVVVLCSNLLLADSSKISPELSGKSGSGNIKIIVQYKDAQGLAAALMTLPLVGGLPNQTFTSLNAVLMSLPLANLERLSENPEVAYISPDRPLTQLLDYSAAAVNAGVATKLGLTGLGVGVAVIDSGITASADLSLGVLPRVVYHENFNGGTWGDHFGHGTHVAGIIAGNGASSMCSNCTRSFAGIAPNATIIDLRVLDDNGQGSDSTVIAAIQRAIQLKNVFNIRVINLSLGRPVYESYTKDPLCLAVEAAWKAGIVVDVAAGNSGRDNSVGNEGYGTIQSPANDPYVITVGAMKAMGTYSRTDDLIASYSSKGPSGIDFISKPDLVAPGNHVVSLEAPKSTLALDPATAVPLSYYQSTNSNSTSTQFMMLNGTSMATPVVSGAVADMLQGEPYLTPDQVKARLMKTAYKQFPTTSTAVDPVTGELFTSTYDIFTIGAGYLDIAAALANHDLASGTAMSPIANYDSVSGEVYLTFDPSATWNTTKARATGTTGVWGSQAVWGSNQLSPDQAVWSNSAVWGTSGVSGFQAVWGTRGVWGTESNEGTSTTQGTRAVWGTDSKTSDSDTVFTVNH